MSDPSSAEENLADISRRSDDVARYYDDWVEDYDTQITRWGYVAPDAAAARLAALLPPSASVLDVGCGTGLTGLALRDRGFPAVDGADVSDRSLAVAAATGAYRRTVHVDFQQLPTPLDTDGWDGLLCVGVLTYLPDTAAVLAEFARLVRPGGWMVITERTDLFETLDVGAVIDDLRRRGTLADARISGPEPYLPAHTQFGDAVEIRYLELCAA